MTCLVLVAGLSRRGRYAPRARGYQRDRASAPGRHGGFRDLPGLLTLTLKQKALLVQL